MAAHTNSFANSMSQYRISLEELNRLASFLASEKCPEAIDIEGMDGLFTALISSPVQTGITEAMERLFGSEPLWESETEREEIYALLLKFWTETARALESKEFLPIVDTSVPLHEQGWNWVGGYFMGIELHPDSWEVLFKDESASMLVLPLSTIALLAQDDMSKIASLHLGMHTQRLPTAATMPLRSQPRLT